MRILSPVSFLLLGFVAGCSAGPADAGGMNYEDVSIDAAAALLADDSDVVVLDIRTPEEYANGHIPGAVLVDYKSAQFAEGLKQLDKGKTYVMH